MQLLNKHALLPDDIKTVLNRLLAEFGDLETTVSELGEKVEAVEDREIRRDEQISEIDERVSELETNVPNFEES